MHPIDELFTAPSEEAVLEKFLTILEEYKVPARSWRPAGALRTMLRVVAKVYAAWTLVLVAFIKSGFLETATGGWLTLLAYYVYGVSRREATFARDDLQLTNGGGGLYSQAAGTVRALNATTGKSYVNTEAFVLNPGETLLVEFEAVEQGAASSSAVGTITELETPLDVVSVTNPSALIGTDAEKDPELRQACLDKLATLSSRGPRGAYRYAVRQATRSNGSPVNINRWRVSPSSTTGIVQVHVAAPSGAPIADDVDAVVDSIEALARPDCVTVEVYAATEVAIARNLTIWAQRTDGADEAAIKALVETAFVREGPLYPLGGFTKPPVSQGYVYADRIKAIAAAAYPSIYEVDGEGADVALSPGQVPVFNITATVRLVDLGTA